MVTVPAELMMMMMPMPMVGMISTFRPAAAVAATFLVMIAIIVSLMCFRLPVAAVVAFLVTTVMVVGVC